MSALTAQPSEQQQRHDVIAQSIHEIDHAVSEAKARMAVAASKRLGIGERARVAFETSLSNIERGTHDKADGQLAREIDAPVPLAAKQEAAQGDRAPSSTRVSSRRTASATVSSGRRALRWIRITALVIAVAPLIVAGPAFVLARVDAISQYLRWPPSTHHRAEGPANVAAVAPEAGGRPAETDKIASIGEPAAGSETPSAGVASDLQSFAAAFTPAEETAPEPVPDQVQSSGATAPQPSLTAALAAAGPPHLVPAAGQPATAAASAPQASGASVADVRSAALHSDAASVAPNGGPSPPTLGEQAARQGEETVRAESPNGAMTEAPSPLRAASASAKAHLDRGQMLASKGDLDGALDEFGQVIRLDPKNAQAFGLRAVAYASRNESDKAINDWTNAIGLATFDPGRLTSLDLFVAYRNRAVLYDGKQLFTREIADLSQMVDSYWKDPELADAMEQAWGGAGAKTFLASIYKLRARAFARTALPDKAIEDLSVAITLDHDHAADAYADRARIEQKLGHRERAATDFRAALKLDPGMPGAKEALARLQGENARRSAGQP